MQLNKSILFLFCLCFSINCFPSHEWGSVSNTGQHSQHTGYGSFLYSELLSVNDNGLLDSSNQIQLVFPGLETQPYIRLIGLELNFYVGLKRYKLLGGSGCLNINIPCEVSGLSTQEVSELLNSTNKVSYEIIFTLLNDDISANPKDFRIGLQYKSNQTKGEFVDIASNIYFRAEKRYACLARVDDLTWNLGKIAPAQLVPQPVSIAIVASGTKQGQLRFRSKDITDGVLTMRDGDRIGPSIVFPESKNWHKCDDNDDESICILHKPSQYSKQIYNAEVNSLGAEPGKYTSYITSTLECS